MIAEGFAEFLHGAVAGGVTREVAGQVISTVIDGVACDVAHDLMGAAPETPAHASANPLLEPAAAVRAGPRTRSPPAPGSRTPSGSPAIAPT